MRTAMILEHLALAREHVARGQQAIAQQLTIVADLERVGHSEHDLSRARAVLAQFKNLQAMHIADRDRLERALTERPDNPP